MSKYSLIVKVNEFKNSQHPFEDAKQEIIEKNGDGFQDIHHKKAILGDDVEKKILKHKKGKYYYVR
jgi:hypothetical protein